MSFEDVQVIAFILFVFVGIPFAVVVVGSNYFWKTSIDTVPQNVTYTFQVPAFQGSDRVQFSVHDNVGFPLFPKYYLYQTDETLPMPQNATFITRDANITVTLSVNYFQSIDGLYTKIGSKDYLIDLTGKGT